MSTTTTSPACALPGAIHRPGIAAWKVAVIVARTASPATAPVAASTPDGTSAATTNASAPLMAAMAAATWSRGLPEKPVPSMASTMTAAPSSAPAANGIGGSPGRRSRMTAASPVSFAGSEVCRTLTLRPAWRRSRATT